MRDAGSRNRAPADRVGAEPELAGYELPLAGSIQTNSPVTESGHFP